MIFTFKQFSCGKSGNMPEDYEDAFCISPETRRFTIADGATASSFAKEWAQLLVEGFVEDDSYLWQLKDQKINLCKFLNWLKGAQGKWNKSISLNSLSWYAEAKVRQGAFASFLGLEIKQMEIQQKAHHWRAIAVGDCNLFYVNNDNLKIAFPLSRSECFGNNPTLLSSSPQSNDHIVDYIRIKQGRIKVGGQFFLCTDALAKWFLIRYENGDKPWDEFKAINTQEEFDASVLMMRKDPRVGNDDMTLVSICYD